MKYTGWELMTVSSDVEHIGRYIFLNDLESFHNTTTTSWTAREQNWETTMGQAFRWPETIYNPIHSRWHHWVKAKRTVLKNKTFFFLVLEPYLYSIQKGEKRELLKSWARLKFQSYLIVDFEKFKSKLINIQVSI